MSKELCDSKSGDFAQWSYSKIKKKDYMKKALLHIASCLFLFMFSCKNSLGQQAVLTESNLEMVNWEETPFAFQGCEMYYKGKRFELGWHKDRYKEIFGEYTYREEKLHRYTFDKTGVLLLGKRPFNGVLEKKDTIAQINIVHYYEFEDYSRIQDDERRVSLEKNNTARPKQFYNKSIWLNGVVLKFGPNGMSVDKANKLLANNANIPTEFWQNVMKSMYRYYPECQQKDKQSIRYLAVGIFDKGINDFDIELIE